MKNQKRNKSEMENPNWKIGQKTSTDISAKILRCMDDKNKQTNMESCVIFLVIWEIQSKSQWDTTSHLLLLLFFYKKEYVLWGCRATGALP